MVYFVKYVSYVCRRLGTHVVLCEVCFLCLQTIRYDMVYFVKYVSNVCRRLGTAWCTL